MGSDDKGSLFDRFMQFYLGLVDVPVTTIREKIVEPIRGDKKNVYYHRRYRRVPTVDQCHTDDEVCYFEANQQYKRDKLVDENIVTILRQKRIECEIFYGPDNLKEKCAKLKEDYEDAATNYFIKYGEMGATHNCKRAYLKQKHRMIWERRHGPVGTGQRPREEWGQ